MCVSLCHRRKLLYFNHEVCPASQCEFAGGGWDYSGLCQSCRHRQGEACNLTRAALPAEGGCCHYNVEPATEAFVVTTRTIKMLPALFPEETIAEILDSYDVYYRLERGVLIIAPDDLAVPETYGLGTEPEVEFDDDVLTDWQGFEFDFLWTENLKEVLQ